VDTVRVLFLCTHNSSRSQMSEGFLRALGAQHYAVASAGTEKTSVHPLAIRAMAERGIDISAHTSKVYSDLPPVRWDYLITVCDAANERCPFMPGVQMRLHWSFEDPSRVVGSEEVRLAVFRQVRDQIAACIARWLSHGHAAPR